MKFDKSALLFNLALLLVIGGYAVATAGMTGLGIGSMIIGVLNLPLAIIAAIAGKKSTSNTAMVMLVVWILIGFSICSSTGLGNLH